MWSAREQTLSSGRVRFVRLETAQGPLTYGDVLKLWQADVTFRTWFNDCLSAAPYAAFRWETPPLTADTLGQPFAFVQLDSPGLARSVDKQAFAEHFERHPEQPVLEFANLGRDALMIVPSPAGPDECYGHLAAFVRTAPEPQRDALWQRVGEAMQRRVNQKPVWLSTAGAGVSWLHVRLDDRPKYYGYTPFRSLK